MIMDIYFFKILIQIIKLHFRIKFYHSNNSKIYVLYNKIEKELYY